MTENNENSQIGVCPVDADEGLKYKLEKKKNNGVVYGFYWFLGMWLARFFKIIRFSPNFVTVLSMISHILAGICFFIGTYQLNIGGGFLVFIGILLDATDGKLARMTRNTSNLGNWLDYNFDYIRYLFLYPPIALAIFRESGNISTLYLAFVSLTFILCSTIIGMRWNLFPFASSVKQEYTDDSKLHTIAKQFYAIAETEPFVILVFAFLDKIYWYLILWSFWNFLYYSATAIYYGIKIAEYDKQ